MYDSQILLLFGDDNTVMGESYRVRYSHHVDVISDLQQRHRFLHILKPSSSRCKELIFPLYKVSQCTRRFFQIPQIWDRRRGGHFCVGVGIFGERLMKRSKKIQNSQKFLKIQKDDCRILPESYDKVM